MQAICYVLSSVRLLKKAQTVVNFKVVLNQDEWSYGEVLLLPHPCPRGLVCAGLHHTQQQNVSYSKENVS